MINVSRFFVNNSGEKIFKNFLKKVLTKAIRCGILSKSSEGRHKISWC